MKAQIKQTTDKFLQIVKFLFAEVLIFLVVCGVLYISNFKVSVTKNIQTVDVISPIK